MAIGNRLRGAAVEARQRIVRQHDVEEVVGERFDQLRFLIDVRDLAPQPAGPQRLGDQLAIERIVLDVHDVKHPAVRHAARLRPAAVR